MANRHEHPDRGAASVELVLIVPALMLVVGLLVYGWRLWSARAEMTGIASAAARAAAMQRSGADAVRVSRHVVDLNLAQAQVRCARWSLSTDVSGFATLPGTKALVTVRLSCSVSLSDLLVAGFPGRADVAVTSTQPIDTWRERRP